MNSENIDLGHNVHNVHKPTKNYKNNTNRFPESEIYEEKSDISNEEYENNLDEIEEAFEIAKEFLFNSLERHKAIYALAAEVKKIRIFSQLPPTAPIFERIIDNWVKELSEIDEEEEHLELLIEFQKCWEKVDRILDFDLLLEKVLDEPHRYLPLCQKHGFKTKHYQYTVGICYHLRKHHESGEFHLACRKLAELLVELGIKRCDKNKANRILRTLTAKGVLKVISRGGYENGYQRIAQKYYLIENPRDEIIAEELTTINLSDNDSIHPGKDESLIEEKHIKEEDDDIPF